MLSNKTAVFAATLWLMVIWWYFVVVSQQHISAVYIRNIEIGFAQLAGIFTNMGIQTLR